MREISGSPASSPVNERARVERARIPPRTRTTLKHRKEKRASMYVALWRSTAHKRHLLHSLHTPKTARPFPYAAHSCSTSLAANFRGASVRCTSFSGRVKLTRIRTGTLTSESSIRLPSGGSFVYCFIFTYTESDCVKQRESAGDKLRNLLRAPDG